MVLTEVLSEEDFSTLQRSNGPVVLFFFAEWHEPSKRGGQMHQVLSALALKYQSIKFAMQEAESIPAISERLGVSVVPTFVCLNNEKIVWKLEGVNPTELAKLVKHVAENPSEVSSGKVIPSAERDGKASEAELKSLVSSAQVMLFMKGSPDAPRCGFSRKAVELLRSQNIQFASFDILTNENVRQGLKTLFDWPTYPQLYVRGELIGGIDILTEMASEGNLKSELGITDQPTLPVPSPKKPLNDRLRELINQAPVMVFMKGSPDSPRCGFSREVVSLLREDGIEFHHFDILGDEDVRQGLKVFSDWPTYPQVYFQGALIGGLDILRDMKEEEPLRKHFQV